MEKDYEQSNSIQPLGVPGGLGAAISISSTILGLMNGPVGTSLSLLNSLVNLLWPADNNVTWEEMIKYVSEMIDQKLELVILNKATSKLIGLKNQINLYYRAVEDHSKNTKTYGLNSPEAYASNELIRSYANTLHMLFIGDIKANFTIKDYETVLLPSYASAAALHVMFLNDVVVRADDIGFPIEDIRHYNTELCLAIEEYSNYCIKTYTSALEKEKAKSWVSFNRCRRTLTLSVLDTIALFSNYDIRKFNPVYYGSKIESFDKKLYTMPIKTEVTREIYSDVLNADVSGVISNDHNTNEDNFIRKPHLFDWINQIEFVSRKYTPTKTFLSGHRIFYKVTPRTSSDVNSGKFYGQGTSYPDTTTSFMSVSDDKYIYKLSTESYNEPGTWQWPEKFYNITKIDFSLTNGKSSSQLTYGNEKNPIRKNEFDLLNRDSSGPSTFNDYSHILSHMLSSKPLYYTETSHGYIFAFTNSSVDPTNTIATDKITQIPAVKAYTLFGANVYAIPSGTGIYIPYIGGDVVELIGFNSYLKIQVKIEPNKKYLVRLHYASGGAWSVNFEFNGSILSNINLDKTVTSRSNLSNYGTFKCTDLGYIEGTSSSYDTIGIQQKSLPGNAPSIFIDKIEFIPYDPKMMQSVPFVKAD